MNAPLAELRGVSRLFPIPGRRGAVLRAVDGVDLAVRRGNSSGWSGSRAAGNRRWRGSPPGSCRPAPAAC